MLLSLLAVYGTLSFAADPVVESARPAITKGLGYIEARGVAWKKDHGCASCHHVPLMVWTENEAKAAGFPVNEAVLNEMTAWLSSEDNAAGLIPGAKAMNPYSLAALYAALALRAAGTPTLDPVRLTGHIVKNQSTEGYWVAPGGRPPMLASDESVSLLSEHVLRLSNPEGFAPTTAKAQAWELSQPQSDDSQVRSLRLLVETRRTQDVDAWLPFIDALVQHQNVDGGWSQSPDLGSDAYATGQALYALANARCGYRYPACVKAISFLAQSQKEDGSWAMVSRPITPGGSGAKNLEPITYAGSAWALLGLIRATTLP